MTHRKDAGSFAESLTLRSRYMRINGIALSSLPKAGAGNVRGAGAQQGGGGEGLGTYAASKIHLLNTVTECCADPSVARSCTTAMSSLFNTMRSMPHPSFMSLHSYVLCMCW